MINCAALYDNLVRRGIGFYCGVPDSVLASFCAYIEDHAPTTSHLVSANEGNAIALAIGYHMASGGIPAVYLQNSGLGNAINPITSLADAEVCRVPMLLIVGWRGEPGIKDEPQHAKQGRITLPLLELLDIPSWTLDANSVVDPVLDTAFDTLRERGSPVALVVRKNAFTPYGRCTQPSTFSMLSREEALSCLLSLIRPQDLLVATTGKTSREVYQLRHMRNEMQRDFLTIGGMGHASSIALGVAIGRPDRHVVCVDGDGALLMHMGALATIGAVAPARYVHVLLNNCAHESVGGQTTVAGTVDFCSVALAVGFKAATSVSDIVTLGDSWRRLTAIEGPTFIEVRIRCGSRDDLVRPKASAEDNKQAFMQHASEL